MFEFRREEENGQKLGNGKRGCVAYIYTLSNDPTHFPAIPPGVGGSKESPSVMAYISTSQGSYCQPGQHQRHNSHCIYTPIVRGWNTPIAITIEMFGLSRLHI